MQVRMNGMMALMIAGTLFVGCADVGEGDRAAVGEEVAIEQTEPTAGGVYTIDTSQSQLRWVGAKVTNSHEGGFHVYDGTIAVDGGEPAHVRIGIDVGTIWTDSEKLIGHLKSPDFFDVEQYPDAVFEADSFQPIDSAGATHLVTGNLTMRGTTNSISFPATITVEPDRVRARANFIIDRQDWGVSYPGAPDDLIRDDVRLTFEVVARQQDGA